MVVSVIYTVSKEAAHGSSSHTYILLSLSLIELLFGRAVEYQGPLSFDLAFTMPKFTSLSICMVCNRALWFWDFAQNSSAPAVHLESARESAPVRARHPWTLHAPGLESYWNPDCRSAGLRTTARQDFYHHHVVCNSSKTERKEGRQGITAAGLLTKIHQNGHQNVILLCHVRC